MADSPPEKRSRENGSRGDMEMFDELFHTLVDDLSKQGLKDEEVRDAVLWFKEVSAISCPELISPLSSLWFQCCSFLFECIIYKWNIHNDVHGDCYYHEEKPTDEMIGLLLHQGHS